jgi:hypothetical protein
MTYGEACIAEQWSIELVKGKWVQTVSIKNKPKPMRRKDAAKYYTKKINKFFGVSTEYTVKDFASVDEYFDYFEAKNILKRLNDENVLKSA